VSNPDRAPRDMLPETTQGHRAMLNTVPKEQESPAQSWDPTSGSHSSNSNTRGTKRGRPTEDGDNNGDDHDVEMVDVAADAGLDANTADGTHRVKRRSKNIRECVSKRWHEKVRTLPQASILFATTR
jgi:hypothetical protein